MERKKIEALKRDIFSDLKCDMTSYERKQLETSNAVCDHALQLEQEREKIAKILNAYPDSDLVSLAEHYAAVHATAERWEQKCRELEAKLKEAEEENKLARKKTSLRRIGLITVISGQLSKTEKCNVVIV